MLNILNSSKSVLHITPHLGGGVGAVLLNFFRNEPYNNHSVVCLDYANENASRALSHLNVSLKDNMHKLPKEILDDIKEVDIVLVHWWNHPLLYDFLVRNKLPKCRLIIWSHISGFYPPYVFTRDILDFPDLFVFTSPISYKVKEVWSRPKENFEVVWSTSGIERFANLKLKQHSGFNIGYIGTQDPSKIYPNFLEMCDRINIDAKFILVGDIDKDLKEKSLKYGSKFEFVGKVDNILDYVLEFDVLGYPLVRDHFGTCEQVLGECMALGIPCVVFNNPAEASIVEHGGTGLIARNELEYVQYIEGLYKSSPLRDYLGEYARNKSLEMYSTRSMIRKWNELFDRVMISPKTSKKWNQKLNTPSEIFLASLGGYSAPFLEGDKSIKKLFQSSPIWRSKTKGTVNHYLYFFPEDEQLKKWSALNESI